MCVREEERWNKWFYVWNHGVRIPSHHNSCALITEGRHGVCAGDKGQMPQGLCERASQQDCLCWIHRGEVSQQSVLWYNMSYAGVYISLYTPLSPIASVGSIQGSESAVIRWATVTAGEPSLHYNECTARLLTLGLAQCWNLGHKWPEMTLVGDANFTPSSPSCVGSLWPWWTLQDLPICPCQTQVSAIGGSLCWPGMRCLETTCNYVKVFHIYTSSPWDYTKTKYAIVLNHTYMAEAKDVIMGTLQKGLICEVPKITSFAFPIPCFNCLLSLTGPAHTVTSYSNGTEKKK